MPEGHLPRLTQAPDETRTRSCVISSIRHVARPQHKRLAGPRLKHHLLIQFAHANRLRSCAPLRNTPYKPRSGIVPPFKIAIRFTPCRGVMPVALSGPTSHEAAAPQTHHDGYRPASISSTPSNTPTLIPAKVRRSYAPTQAAPHTISRPPRRHHSAPPHHSAVATSSPSPNRLFPNRRVILCRYRRMRNHRHHLLRQHIQRVPQKPR